MKDTERVNKKYPHLDLMPTEMLANSFIEDQQLAIEANRAALASIARAVDLAHARMVEGGRLIYAGAGTSGRLSMLDAVELHPTFSWPAERAVFLVAGGESALKYAVEGAEDDAAMAHKDFMGISPNANDVVIAVAASGSTPYCMAILQSARALGCLCICIVNNQLSPMLEHADVPVVLETGPEVIAGSTRLKAGTAQKIALNTFSSSLMVRLNKVYGNLMVDMHITNDKLRGRAISIICQITGADEGTATRHLQESGSNIKTAIVSILCKLPPAQAQSQLQHHRGSIRSVVDSLPQPVSITA
jgi:N-acetylmuramic acid 6-phosphate etherase